MTPPSSNDDILRRYLLGKVTPEAQKSVEERLFSDNQIFWEHLCLVEDDLINDYARGALDDQETADFERHFLCTDERRAKLELARALQAYVERQSDDRRPALHWLRSPVVAPVWTVAAAAVLMLVVPGAVWQFAPRGPGEPRDLVESRSAQGIKDVQAALETALAERSREARGGSVVSVSLSPGLVRSVGAELTRLRIPRGAQLMRLQLDPGSQEYAAYRATLHEVSGDELWSQAKLTPTQVIGGVAITITLPSEWLPDGDYYVRLSGVSPGANPVLLHRYDFRVLRQ